MTKPAITAPPLIVHLVYRLAAGGLENGVVNLINGLPSERYRHAIVCLTDSTAFSQRIQRDDVSIVCLGKRPGFDGGAFIRFYRLLLAWRPLIVHSRNLAALEYQACAWLAGVPVRLHGEHGWDVFDPVGDNRRYQWLRRVMARVVDQFVPVSRQLQHYLQATIGIPKQQISRIVNGVDSQRFRPRHPDDALPVGFPAGWQSAVVVGWVGRMQAVKDPLALVKAFCLACQASPRFADNARLVLIGDGPLHAEAVALLRQQQRLAQAWLPGERDDIPVLMRCLDVFVLPSQAEGVSNTVLEAMASGLPVIATAVGGNLELVVNTQTGILVAPQDNAALAQALQMLTAHAEMRQHMGAAGRLRVEQRFSLPVMLQRYQQLYDRCLDAALVV